MTRIAAIISDCGSQKQLLKIVKIIVALLEVGKAVFPDRISSRLLAPGGLFGGVVILVKSTDVLQTMYVILMPAFEDCVGVLKTGLMDGGHRSAAGFQNDSIAKSVFIRPLVKKRGFCITEISSRDSESLHHIIINGRMLRGIGTGLFYGKDLLPAPIHCNPVHIMETQMLPVDAGLYQIDDKVDWKVQLVQPIENCVGIGGAEGVLHIHLNNREKLRDRFIPLELLHLVERVFARAG